MVRKFPPEFLLRRAFQSMREIKELTSAILDLNYSEMKESDRFTIDEYIATCEKFIEAANKFKNPS